MASKEAVKLENHVKLFVDMKLGENVSLELRFDCVIIRPSKKVGSISLGSFWVRVLQSYFSKKEYTYQKSYNRKTASELITVTIDEFLVEVHLRTGLVTIDGHDAYRWFKHKFPKVMKSYDKKTGATPLNYFSDQVISDTRKEMRRVRSKPAEYTEGETVDHEEAFVSSDVGLNEEQEAMIVERLHSSVSLHATEELVPADVYPHSTAGLGTVAIKDAESFVYPIWRQSLNKWFNNGKYKVYVATEAFDCERLRDLFNLGAKNKLTMNLHAVYCPPLSNHGIRMSEMKKSLMRGLTNEEQLFMEYKIFNKFHYPKARKIGCNFVAGVANGIAEVLMTSASFDENGLAALNNLVSVTFTKMIEEDFCKNFIDKLATI